VYILPEQSWKAATEAAGTQAHAIPHPAALGPQLKEAGLLLRWEENTGKLAPKINRLPERNRAWVMKKSTLFPEGSVTAAAETEY
jgi:hypothetical protein